MSDKQEEPQAIAELRRLILEDMRMSNAVFVNVDYLAAVLDAYRAEKEAHEKTKRDYREYRRWATPCGGLDEA